MRKFLSLLLTLAMVFSLAVTVQAEEAEVTAAPAAAEEDLAGSIIILHTNDVHGQTDRYAQVAALKQTYEKMGAYVLLFDAGDYIQGDPTVSLSEGATAVELMNLAGYDAAALGNHEFDYGYENLVKLAKEAKFPILSANTLYNGSVAFEDHVTFTAPDGTKIGVFGLETPETATKAHPAKIKGVTFAAGEEMFRIAQAQVDALRADKCDVIVCLGHLGIDNESAGNRSIDLLEKVKGIDVFIDAHSHSTLEDILAVTNQTGLVGDTLLTSTGTKLAGIGCVVIKDGAAVAMNLPYDELTTTPDETVAARAAEIAKQIEDDYGTPFAKSLVELNGAKAPNGNRDGETNNGDLITDAILWYATKDGGLDVDADHTVALTNGGGIRAAISIGDITKKDVNTVLPFGNTVAVIYVTGAELLEALEASTYCTPDAVGGFPQVAGIQFTVDTTKAYDAGDLYPGSTYHAPKSINRVTIESINGKAFDPAAKYAVVTNDFTAAGGDTYYAFSVADVMNTGVPLDQVVMDYITTQLGGVIGEQYAAPQGRITVKTAPVEEAVPTEPEQPAQPEPQPEQPSTPAAGETYVVIAGDCLWNIAYKLYGTGALYTKLAEANKIADPYVIYIGQILTVPAK